MTPESAALLQARDARARELAQRLVLQDASCRQTLLAIHRAATPTQVVTLVAMVDNLDSLALRTWNVLLGPRADVLIDPDGQRVLRDLDRLEQAGHAALFFYILDVRASARLAYCVSLNVPTTGASA